MDADELRNRTKSFALNVARFVQTLPSSHGSDRTAASVLGHQLLRSGASVGANYRAACRAKSRADFISKLKIVEEECDEALYWMELLSAIRIGNTALLPNLMKEAGQILSIIVASIRTARKNIDD